MHHARACLRLHEGPGAVLGLGWVTSHNHAVMWVLLTHSVEWREVVPCHMATGAEAGVRLALSEATGGVAPATSESGGLEGLLSSRRAALRVRVLAWW